MTTELQARGWAGRDMTPVRAPVITGAGAVEKKQRRKRGGRGRSAVLLPGDRAGPLRLGQDLTCSAGLAGVALLLSHRDHEPRASSKIRNIRGMNLTVSAASDRVRAGRRHKFARWRGGLRSRDPLFMGVTLGATGMNNLLVPDCHEQRAATHPRSRTDLNGAGRLHGYLRI